jgi:hypothetical protein
MIVDDIGKTTIGIKQKDACSVIHCVITLLSGHFSVCGPKSLRSGLDLGQGARQPRYAGIEIRQVVVEHFRCVTFRIH